LPFRSSYISVFVLSPPRPFAPRTRSHGKNCQSSILLRKRLFSKIFKGNRLRKHQIIKKPLREADETRREARSYPPDFSLSTMETLFDKRLIFTISSVHD
jgi:hypothetical protein